MMLGGREQIDDIEKTIGVCGLFGAHNRTINGDNFGFALNVCLTPCTGGSEVIKVLHILFKKTLQPYR